MGKASSVKGAKAERDICAWLSTRLGLDIKRMLGAGRKEDVGDVHGLTGFTVQVANRASLGDVLRYKPLECELQQIHGRTAFGVTLMKLPPVPGGKPQEWRAVMTLEQFCQVWEAINSEM